MPLFSEEFFMSLTRHLETMKRGSRREPAGYLRYVILLRRRGMKRKILVVEDNEQNLYLVAFLLQKDGYEVIAARDGHTAIEKAQAERPDLILMDIQLPEMDGYEATRRIKSTSDISHIPIVAITSYAMAGDPEKALAAGCAGYIEKPFAPETFVAEIKKYF